MQILDVAQNTPNKALKRVWVGDQIKEPPEPPIDSLCVHIDDVCNWLTDLDDLPWLFCIISPQFPPEICLHDHKVVRNHGDPAGCGKNRTFCAACDAMQMKSNSTEKEGTQNCFHPFYWAATVILNPW